MDTNEKFAEAEKRTKQWGQEHLLRFCDELDAASREQLLDAILRTDFELVERLFQASKADASASVAGQEILPAGITDKASADPGRLKEAAALGLEAIEAGQYAVVTMAGGQGTRLGYDGPKGTYQVRLDREKTLFEVQLERIRNAGGKIPWYIMTSPENHDATVRFFCSNDCFGYRDIVFFQQSSLPMVGLDGRILLEEKHRIKEGPDGNGSVFRSMLSTGVAEDMRKRGVKWFFMCNVDNILTQCADPLPIGLAVQSGTLCASKSVLKRNPQERAGVFCRRKGKPAVIEYTELPRELAEMTGKDGALVYGDAHISCTVFSTEVLELDGAIRMPYHTALKKASYIGDDGSKIIAEKENALKFEAFIFDVFPSLDDMVVLRVDREEEFAPIKNAHGEDSPDTARELYMKSLYRNNGTFGRM